MKNTYKYKKVNKKNNVRSKKMHYNGGNTLSKIGKSIGEIVEQSVATGAKVADLANTAVGTGVAVTSLASTTVQGVDKNVAAVSNLSANNIEATGKLTQTGIERLTTHLGDTSDIISKASTIASEYMTNAKNFAQPLVDLLIEQTKSSAKTVNTLSKIPFAIIDIAVLSLLIPFNKIKIKLHNANLTQEEREKLVEDQKKLAVEIEKKTEEKSKLETETLKNEHTNAEITPTIAVKELASEVGEVTNTLNTLSPESTTIVNEVKQTIKPSFWSRFTWNKSKENKSKGGNKNLSNKRFIRKTKKYYKNKK